MRPFINVSGIATNPVLFFKKFGKWTFAFFLIKGLAWILLVAGVTSFSV